MSEDLVITVVDSSARPLLARVLVVSRDEVGEPELVELEAQRQGVLTAPNGTKEGERAIVIPQAPGHWVTHLERCEAGERVICEILGAGEKANWWHALLGRHATDTDRGCGVRIGIVDSNFVKGSGLETVKLVPLKGAGPPEPIASGMWKHGEVVCRILGDSCAPSGCAPIAPGASIFFASASFTRATLGHPRFRLPVAEPEDDLDPVLVREAIFTLAFDHHVDLINLSLGTFDDVPPEDGLIDAIRLARSQGVAFVCAGGNMPCDSAAFPARLEECIGVGAYGVLDWGPPSSFASFVARNSTQQGLLGDLKIFHMPGSVYGNGIDTIAPGVGLHIARNGCPAYDVTGTSFAAPVVTGLLAVELALDSTYRSLPRTEVRARHAEELLRALCVRTGIDENWEGCGAVRLA